MFLVSAVPPLIGNKYRAQLMIYWNHNLPLILKNHTSSISEHNTIPPFLQTRRNPENNPNNVPFTFAKPNRHTFTNRIPTSTPVFGRVLTKPSDRETDKEDMFGMRNEYGRFVTAAPSQEERSHIGIVMSSIIIVCLILLIGNVIVCAVLYYKRTKLKMEERNLKRQYEDMQNANLDLETGGNTLREKMPLTPLPVSDTTTQGCNVMKMIRQSTKSEDTYEAVKASEGSSQRFKLTRQISSSTLDPHTKVRDWIAHEIVQRCSPRFLRKTRHQHSTEHRRKDSVNKTPKSVKKSSPLDANASPPTRPVSPECKNSSVASSQKPRKVSVGIDATADARSSSVLKQEPIELTKSVDSGSPPVPGRIRRSMTLEDFTLEEKERPALKRQSSITDLTLPKQPIGEDRIIKINHQYSRSDPVDTTVTLSPKLKTFDPNEDINVTSKDEIPNNSLSPEEALQTIKRRNFPKVLPDFPTDTDYNSSMKRRSLPAHHLLNLSTFSGNRAATLDQSYQKLYSRIPPAPPPRTSSTLGRKSSNGNTVAGPIFPQVRLAEEPPFVSESIVSNTLHVGPLIPNRIPVKKIDNQPIYDSLKSLNEDSPLGSIKSIPKTIISADKDQPIKRNEPKVIIKPNTSSLKRDPMKTKTIPRVLAKDNDDGSEIYSRQSSVSSVSSSPVPQSPVNTSSPIPIPPPLPPMPEPPEVVSIVPEVEKNNSPDTSSEESTASSSSSDTGTVVKRQ